MESERANVLFVDDDRTYVNAIIRSMMRCGADFCCHEAVNAAEALRLAERVKPEVAVLDLELDDYQGVESGLQLITEIVKRVHHVRVLVATGHNELHFGVSSLNAGATSFVSKAESGDHFFSLICDGIVASRLMRAADNHDKEVSTTLAALGMTTRSEAMLKVIEEIAVAASAQQPVLLYGETGVGKNIVAHAIHRAGKRSERPFVRMQPQFGSSDLISSELFGHTRGSFTGATENRVGLIEEANGGTLFLDELDGLPHQTQITLLHVLQEKEFQKIGTNRKCRSDFRLISASNVPLENLSDGVKLRPDFFHRVAHTRICIPPLRERRADIAYLAREFVNRFAAEEKGTSVSGISNEALTWLAAQPWPGNIRQLQGLVSRGCLHANYHRRRLILLSDLQESDLPRAKVAAGTLTEQLEVYEQSITANTFAENDRNCTATAKVLGIDRKRVRRILARGEC